MARFEASKSTRRVRGLAYEAYENDFVVSRDDGSCYKCFSDYKEAEAYYNYLQSLDDKQQTLKEQKRAADEIAALRQTIEKQYQTSRQNQIDREQLLWKESLFEQERAQYAERAYHRKLQEQREDAILLNMAYEIDSGSLTYNKTNQHEIGKILRKKIYTFKNLEAIGMLAENIKFNDDLEVFIDNYGHVTGVCDRLLNNPKLRYNLDCVEKLVEANKGNTRFLVKLFSKKFPDEDIYSVLEGEIPTLKYLLENNLLPDSKIRWAQEWIYTGNNKDRILAGGDIESAMDLKIAEDAYFSMTSYPYRYLIQLAGKTSKKEILDSIPIRLQKRNSTLSQQDKIDICFTVYENPNYDLYYKREVIRALIDILTEKAQLEGIEHLCKNSLYDPSRHDTDFLYYDWLRRMQSLGYLTESQRNKKLNQQNRTGGSGCMVIIAILATSLTLTLTLL